VQHRRFYHEGGHSKAVKTPQNQRQINAARGWPLVQAL